MFHRIMKASVENCEYLISQKIRFHNFMIISSYAWMVREAPKFKLQKVSLCENKYEQDLILKGILFLKMFNFHS